jgi:DNA primase small subunit
LRKREGKLRKRKGGLKGRKAKPRKRGRKKKPREVKVEPRTLDFIKARFREYYSGHGVTAPLQTERREFGFGDDKKIDYRHFAFKTGNELHRYLSTNAPLYASFSAAYYEFPDGRPMPKKGFLGADLIFEFDAECGHGNLACEQCLDGTKQQSLRLIEEFLVPDFGFDRRDISVVFSGNRGYHIYVVNDAVKQFGQEARKQIIDYLMARNLDIPRLIRAGATVKSKGWAGRLARAAYRHAQQAGGKRFSDRDFVLGEMAGGNYDLFKGAHSFWQKLLSEEVVHMTSDIDHTVTLDMSRLIRIPTTLHGGSSLLCMPVASLDRFNPFVDAVVFSDRKMNVRMLNAAKEIVLREQAFGPFEAKKEYELPEHAAMFLICKGAAEPAGN